MAFAHALATGIAIALTYLALDRAGALRDRSMAGKLAISLPAYFVVILVLNLIWPYPG